MVNSLGLTERDTEYKGPYGTIFGFCSKKLGGLFVLFSFLFLFLI